MPNGEQEQDSEEEASGGDSGEWHSDEVDGEERGDSSDEEEVDSPPHGEKKVQERSRSGKPPRHSGRTDWAVFKASLDVLSSAD